MKRFEPRSSMKSLLAAVLAYRLNSAWLKGLHVAARRPPMQARLKAQGANESYIEAINRVLRQGVRPSSSSRSSIPIVLPDWCEKGTSPLASSRLLGIASKALCTYQKATWLKLAATKD